MNIFAEILLPIDLPIRKLMMHLPRYLMFTALLIANSFVVADEPNVQDSTPEPQEPKLVAASSEGVDQIKQFKFPENLRCEVFAAEPMVANIVAIHRDYAGRMFAAENYRGKKGVEDNRNHREWLNDDLAAQTVQDRIDYMKRHHANAVQRFTTHDDRIRMLLDTNGDGVADQSTVFANRFNRMESGIGAGVLSYRGDVFYTCIPDLFLLKDTNGDGVADVRRSLHAGFGVRTAFHGHDMHGLIIGPDRRLYFSIGDRGYNVSPEIHDATSGAVFRCELDGSNLEVYATGLRNPQELAFDDYGNLFTGDNNSDSGDKARWVYVVEGGDTGWRMYYQYERNRGPFNREKIWHPYSDESPAYIVPPVANLGDGPSGLEYYPGTGLGDEFKGQFFLCDFRGTPSKSGIRTIRNIADGAFWKVENMEQPFWQILATDLDFGSDGKMYVSDWVQGWVGEMKGRIYTFYNPETVNSKLVKEVEQLLGGEIAKKSNEQLVALLGHVDQRVRQESQFELVDRQQFESLQSVALNGTETLPRVHAIWGLRQLARTSSATTSATAASSTATLDFAVVIAPLLKDADAEIRAQAAEFAADACYENLGDLLALLRDENLRVRYFAAMALSKIGDVSCANPIAEMLIENADRDPIVRHGGIMAIKHLLSDSKLGSQDEATKLGQHSSASVRLAFVVALRKCLSTKVPSNNHETLAKLLAGKLQDTDAGVYAEVVRAIHDLPIDDLMPVLANEIDLMSRHFNGGILDDAIARRVINANFRIGDKANAIALARFAANQNMNRERRIGAIEALSQWMNPPNLDRVTNDWQPINTENRTLVDAQAAFVNRFADLVGQSSEIASAAIKAAGDLKLTEIGDDLEKTVLSDQLDEPTRVAALVSLNQIGFKKLPATLKLLTNQFAKLPSELAATTASIIAADDEPAALGLLEEIIARAEASTASKQLAIGRLGTMLSAESQKRLLDLLSLAKARELAPELCLDVVLAAEKKTSAELKKAVADYRQSIISADEPTAAYIDTKFGGDANRGRQIFFGKTEVSCVRCHRVDGTGGEVGPDLSGVAIKNDRQYLLEAIVEPNKAIPEGFAQIKVQTIDGLIQVGLLVSENDDEMVLLDADGKKIVISQDDIDDIKPGLSAMPDDLVKQLSLVELRDLIEYLANRKSLPKPVEEEGHKLD